MIRYVIFSSKKKMLNESATARERKLFGSTVLQIDFQLK